MTDRIDNEYALLPDGPDEMGRELARGPDAVADTLAEADRLAERVASERAASDRLVLVGTGASLAMAIAAAPWFRANDPVGRERPVVVREACAAALGDLDGEAFRSGDLVIAISVSGSSPETVAAARLARAQGARILAVAAPPGSPLADGADLLLRVPMEREHGASTASALGTLAGLAALAGACATGLQAASSTRDALAALVADLDPVVPAGRLISGARHVWLAGFGPAEGLARAGALLLHEKALLPAVGTTPSEFRHGLIEATQPGDVLVVVDLVPRDPRRAAYAGQLSREVAGAGVGQVVIAVGSDAIPPAPGSLVPVPGEPGSLAMLAALLRIQQLGRVVAHARGTYEDGFRYLRTIVTAAEVLLPPVRGSHASTVADSGAY